MLCTWLAELTQRIDDELAQAGSGAAIDYGALEQRVADALGEVERGLHAQVLARLDIDVPAIRVWGDEYRRIGRFESDYHTLAGTVRVMRTVYRKAGRNGDTLDPVSVRAGVVADGWLPHTARAMAHLLALGTSREAEATGRALARLLERVGRSWRGQRVRAWARNGSDEDRRRKAGFCNEVIVLEPHPIRGVWIQYCDAFAAVTCGIHKVNAPVRGSKTGFGGLGGRRAGWGVAKIELPESWAGVAEPLRALMAEVEREAHARQREGTRSGVLAPAVRFLR